MSVLVIGATGNIGSEVVQQMVAAKMPVVAAVRNIEKAKKKLGDKPRYVSFDYEQPNTFVPAMEGISHLFLIAPPNHKNAHIPVTQLIASAEIQEIEHMTLLSGRTTGDVPGSALNQIEALIRNCERSYSIVRPSWFMQNFHSWLGRTIINEDRLYLPAGDAKLSFVDVRDIGAVVVKTLTESGHSEQTYELTGHEILDHHKVASKISKAVGREITYQPMEKKAFIQLMQKKGWTEAAATFTAYLFDLVKTGKEAQISPDVERILERKPIIFDQYAADYADAWKK